jgi:hypothetical protein
VSIRVCLTRGAIISYIIRFDMRSALDYVCIVHSALAHSHYHNQCVASSRYPVSSSRQVAGTRALEALSAFYRASSPQQSCRRDLPHHGAVGAGTFRSME